MEEDHQDEGFPFTAVKIEPEDDWQIESEQNEASSSEHTMEKTEPSNADSHSLDEGESSQESDKFSSFTPAITSNSGCDVPDEEPGTSWSGTIKQEVDSDDEMDSQSSNEPHYGSSYIEGSDNPHWSSLCDEMKAEVEEDNFDDFEPEENFDDSESEEIFEDLEPRDKTSTGNMIIPDGLCIQETKEEDGQKTRKGIWTTKFLSRGLVFGPYADATRTPGSRDSQSEPTWPEFIMQRWNFPEINIEIRRTNEQLFLRVIKDINPFTELVQRTSQYPVIKPTETSFNAKTRSDAQPVHHTGVTLTPCTLCSRNFSSSNEIEDHNMLHRFARELDCRSCRIGLQKPRFGKIHLLAHKRGKTRASLGVKALSNPNVNVGGSPSSYICHICDRVYKSPINLYAHYELHKDKEGAMRCNICEKSFTNLNQILSHMAIHRRKTKTICYICGKARIGIDLHLEKCHRDIRLQQMTKT